MSQIVKALDTEVTDELLEGLIGKIIHCPTNKHDVAPDATGAEKELVNAWFAGQVAGVEKATIAFDFETGEYLDKPVQYHNVLLTDGKGYLISSTACEIVELTEAEWTDMVSEHEALELVNDQVQEMILPERRIIMPDEVR